MAERWLGRLQLNRVWREFRLACEPWIVRNWNARPSTRDSHTSPSLSWKKSRRGILECLLHRRDAAEVVNVAPIGITCLAQPHAGRDGGSGQKTKALGDDGAGLRCLSSVSCGEICFAPVRAVDPLGGEWRCGYDDSRMAVRCRWRSVAGFRVAGG